MLTIYTKEGCAFCTRAKTFLNEMGIPFTEKKLDVDYTREVLMESFPSARTFPVIVNGDQFVGGYTELVEAVKNGNTFTQQQLNG